MSLVRIDNGSLAFGHVAILDDIALSIEPGERVCLVGRNGTGKSTLLNVIASDQVLDGGRLRIGPMVRIAKLAQEVPTAAHATLFEIVAQGLGDHRGLLADYHEASLRLTENPNDTQALTRLGQLQEDIDRAGAWEGSQRIEATLSRLALLPDEKMSECSGGIRRRAMLGQALVSQPDVLLLDEPTNHLDIESITGLEEALQAYPGAVVFVTHDRTLIQNLATRIVELDRGQLRSYPGDYAEYLRRKEGELKAEADANRKFDQNLQNEEVWIREGIKARRTRNEGRVRRLEAMRRERADRRERISTVKLAVDRGVASGKLVIEAESVNFTYDRKPVIGDLNVVVMRGDRIGVIGQNGSGKSTLLKLLLGDLQPDSGAVRRGTKCQIAYFDQERMQLNLEASVIDNVCEGSDTITIGNKSRHVVSYLADFLFPPARTRSPVKTLSGGERNRLLLAKLFAQPANLLVLDEPTNDLDIETLELLEELLSEYDGTLLLVSHDRSFLDRTVTSTLVLDGEGGVEEFVGGYSDWLRQKASTDAEAQKRKQTPTSTVSQPPVKKRAKLSYKEQRELDSLPALIEELEAEQTCLQEQTSDPAFYDQPQAQVAATLQKLTDLQTRLSETYARWEELEA